MFLKSLAKLVVLFLQCKQPRTTAPHGSHASVEGPTVISTDTLQNTLIPQTHPRGTEQRNVDQLCGASSREVTAVYEEAPPRRALKRATYLADLC